MHEVDRVQGPGSWSVGIYYDEDASYCDPRDNDNATRMVCFHKRYRLGDKHDYVEADYSSWDEVRDAIERKEGPLAGIWSIYMIDHSGVAFRLCRDFGDCDPGGWDSGRVGFMFITEKALKEGWGTKRPSTEELFKIAETDLSEYGKWCNGEVYGYVVTCEDGDKDSCWGFIGIEWAIESAKEAMKYAVEAEQEALELERRGFAL